MHLVDGFLDARTCAATAALAAAGAAAAFRKTRGEYGLRQAPLAGTMSACVFALQMVQFPILPGASGHVMGGALAAVVLGPAAAVACLSAVLVVQCLLFGDGGVASLGANVLNMAIVAPLTAHFAFNALRKLVTAPGAAGACAAAAAWLSLVAASAACAIELACAGAYPLQFVLPALTGVHALIAVVEGAVTGAALAYIARTRPDLLPAAITAPRPAGPSRRLLAGCGAAIVVALAAAPWSSAAPDGLEYTLEKLGLVSTAHAETAAPMADYHAPGVGWPWLAAMLAGGAGASLTFGLAWLAMRRKKAPGDA